MRYLYWLGLFQMFSALPIIGLFNAPLSRVHPIGGNAEHRSSFGFFLGFCFLERVERLARGAGVISAMGTPSFFIVSC